MNKEESTQEEEPFSSKHIAMRRQNKCSVPESPEELMEKVRGQRQRKNAQSRARQAKLKEKLEMIRLKAEHERTEEESLLLQKDEAKRFKKNNRSRDRASQKKAEMERILSKPEHKRTLEEQEFLEITMNAKARKNLGDRQRRVRIKQEKRAKGLQVLHEYKEQEEEMDGFPFQPQSHAV